MLVINGYVNCGFLCNFLLSNSELFFSIAEPITAFPGENFYFPGKIALLFLLAWAFKLKEC